MIVTTLVRRVRDLESRVYFGYIGGSWFQMNCAGCHKPSATISVVSDPNPEEAEFTGAPLCFSCSMRLPTLDHRVTETWPKNITALEVEHVWADAKRQMQQESKAVAARPLDRITTLEDLRRTLRAALSSAQAI